MPRDVVLTRKQFEALLGACQGHPHQVIAENNGIAVNTVRSRMKSLYAILQVDNAYDAVRQAWKLKILRTCPVCRRPRSEDAPPVAFTDRAVAKATFVDTGEPDLPDLTLAEVSGEADRLVFDRVSCELPALLLETLRMAASGYSTKEIARHQGLSVSTVNVNISHMYARLGVHERGAAVAMGCFKGYVTEEHVRFYRQGK